MKNKQQVSQKGSATLMLIVIIILGIGSWLYFNKQSTKPLESVVVMEESKSTTTTTVTSQPETVAATPTQSENKITEQDILGATYTISAKFDSKKTAPQNVKLPYVPTGSENKERLYITQDGSVVTEPKAGSEMFYISSYKFTNSNNTEATVYVTGSYGASGYDNRMFTVTKVDGQIVTKEILRF